MAFQQGLSGLSTASKALDAISNNVSNAGTVGFKQSAAQFSDVFASSLAGAGTQVGIGASIDRVSQQFSQGNISTTTNSLDLAINGQGFFQMRNPGGSVADISYSRNGQFQNDKNGYIINAQGLRLTGKQADTTGALTGSTGDIKLDFRQSDPKATTAAGYSINLDARSATPSALDKAQVVGSGAPTYPLDLTGSNTMDIVVDGNAAVDTPVAITVGVGPHADTAALVSALQSAIDKTTLKDRVTVASDSAGNISLTSARSGRQSNITVAGNVASTLNLPSATALATNAAFDYRNPATYTSTTSQVVYDSQGSPHTQSLYFVKTAKANEWDIYTSLDGGNPPEIDALTGTHTPNTVHFNANGVLEGATSFSSKYTVSSSVNALDFTVDLTGSTQYGNAYGVNKLSQDGYTTGTLSGLSVSADGLIEGNFSNGKSRVMGQVLLASFQNPNGLQSLGGNQWRATPEAGQLAGSGSPPGSGILGALQAGAVEESNVDLTSELVNMITQQRSYQANAQTIKTQDQLLQTLVNLR